MADRCPMCGRRATRRERQAAERRDLICAMLAGGAPASQGAIVRALLVAGRPVTQATVSRDLSRLGAVRHARTRWALPSAVPRTRRSQPIPDPIPALGGPKGPEKYRNT